MGKPKRERSLANNEAKAVTKTLRVSPRKLNLVAGLIRGKIMRSPIWSSPGSGSRRMSASA
jgi:large subunit ribosomal protein L22